MYEHRKKSHIIFFISCLSAMIIAIILIILLIWTSVSRELTQLENSLFQIISIFLGFLGSYGIGKIIANESKNLHARPAFRRIVSLYQSLSRMAQETENSISNKNIDKEQALATMKIMLVEQIATVDDAVNDWKDIIPEDVNELLRDFKSNQPIKGK